jgi:hypothetical protein
MIFRIAVEAEIKGCNKKPVAISIVSALRIDESLKSDPTPKKS